MPEEKKENEPRLETWKGDLYCPSCSMELAPGYDIEQRNTPDGRWYTALIRFLRCSNQNCPDQHKKRSLPKI